MNPAAAKHSAISPKKRSTQMLPTQHRPWPWLGLSSPRGDRPCAVLRLRRRLLARSFLGNSAKTRRLVCCRDTTTPTPTIEASNRSTRNIDCQPFNPPIPFSSRSKPESGLPKMKARGVGMSILQILVWNRRPNRQFRTPGLNKLRDRQKGRTPRQSKNCNPPRIAMQSLQRPLRLEESGSLESLRA
jgi:hypothetical protein